MGFSVVVVCLIFSFNGMGGFFWSLGGCFSRCLVYILVA